VTRFKRLPEFPKDAKQDAGYQLDQVQRGNQPATSSPCRQSARASRRSGCRVWDDAGTYRVIYTARLVDVVYVLHAFQKKTQATAKQDLEIAKERFAQLMRARR
jgi:phage-related protein